MSGRRCLAHAVPEGALFYAPDLLDGERRMTFYRRGNDGDVEDVSRYVRIYRLGIMQFRVDGQKRINLRVKQAGSVGLLARNLPVVQIGKPA